MFYCNECKEIFDEYDAEARKEYPNSTDFPNSYYTYLVCPNCHSDNIQEAQRCELCGEWHPEDEGEECETCKLDFDEILSNYIREARERYGADKEQIIEAIGRRIDSEI